MVRMLKNPFYAGLMAWNGQRHMGRHEPIITLAEHQRIVQIIDAHNLHACRRRKHGFLLRGFVYCNICGHRYTAETHPAKHKSYYRCATRREHSNLRQNVEVDVLERQVDEQFKTIQFSPKFIAAVTKRLQQLHATHKSTAQERKQVFSNQQKAIEQKRDKAEEKLLAGILSDDAFVRLRKGFTEQLQQIQEQIATLDSQRECDIDVVRQILSLLRNIYQTYKKAPDALKRLYLGIFWEQFLVQDKEIVKAVPTELIRVLQQEREVLLSSKKRASPPLIRTLQNVPYLKSLRERLLTIEALQSGLTHKSLSL